MKQWLYEIFTVAAPHSRVTRHFHFAHPEVKALRFPSLIFSCYVVVLRENNYCAIGAVPSGL